MKRFLQWLGFHFHDWTYTDEDEATRDVYPVMRTCPCGLVQEFIAVPSAIGAFTSWLDVDEDN